MATTWRRSTRAAGQPRLKTSFDICEKHEERMIWQNSHAHSVVFINRLKLDQLGYSRDFSSHCSTGSTRGIGSNQDVILKYSTPREDQSVTRTTSKPLVTSIDRRTFIKSSTAIAAGLALSPAIAGRAQAATLKLKLSTSLPNDPKYSNGRVYYDNLV